MRGGEIMNAESIKIITEYLDKVAGQIGVAGAEVWPWFIKQQYVDSAIAVTAFFITGVALYFTVRYAFAHWKPETGYSIYNSDHEAEWYTAIGLLTLLFFISTVTFLKYGFKLLNPEYHALMKLLSAVKP
jgi:hypothetical protein